MRIFAPGFRLSVVDIAVLVVGFPVSVALATVEWTWGFVVAFVLAHFFLFCNVVRMARPLELVWATMFTVQAGSTIVAGLPGWIITTTVSLATTLIVVAIEMRKPSYHGIAWQRINPNLQVWWETHIANRSNRR